MLNFVTKNQDLTSSVRWFTGRQSDTCSSLIIVFTFWSQNGRPWHLLWEVDFFLCFVLLFFGACFSFSCSAQREIRTKGRICNRNENILQVFFYCIKVSTITFLFCFSYEDSHENPKFYGVDLPPSQEQFFDQNFKPNKLV